MNIFDMLVDSHYANQACMCMYVAYMLYADVTLVQ